jgi:hypothetical protein
MKAQERTKNVLGVLILLLAVLVIALEITSILLPTLYGIR